MSRHPSSLLALLCILAVLTGCAATAPPAATDTSSLASILDSAANAETSVVAISPPAPCCPKQTLPQFLGIRNACAGVLGGINRLRNRLGMAFPGLEAKPELLSITDPANMSEDAPPAVQAAADIKSQEDQAAQKIKAIRYLATIGCGGCYPDVEDALIAAMEDCTEEVRYEAVLAVRKTTSVKCCYCSCDACCTEKIQKKLRELADGQPCPCCRGEQSARIRRQARLALAACGPPVILDEPDPEPEKIEKPTEGPSENPSEGQSGGGEETNGVPVEELQEPAEDKKTIEVTDGARSILPTTKTPLSTIRTSRSEVWSTSNSEPQARLVPLPPVAPG